MTLLSQEDLTRLTSIDNDTLLKGYYKYKEYLKDTVDGLKGAVYITPNAEFVDVCSKFKVHKLFAADYLSEVLNTDNHDTCLQYLDDILGFIRVNLGNTKYDSRAYIVTPRFVTPSSQQYEKLIDLLYYLMSKSITELTVYIKYTGKIILCSLKETFPEDIVNEIKKNYL